MGKHVVVISAEKSNFHQTFASLKKTVKPLDASDSKTALPLR